MPVVATVPWCLDALVTVARGSPANASSACGVPSGSRIGIPLRFRDASPRISRLVLRSPTPIFSKRTEDAVIATDANARHSLVVIIRIRGIQHPYHGLCTYTPALDRATDRFTMPHYIGCTEVSVECPVSDTTYGYRPNLGGNIFFLVVFGICTIAQLALGIRYRLRGFTFAVSLGCLGETIGYGGRLMMHANPWSQTGFKVQICCLILSPSFLAAGIYLTLKHLVIYFGPGMSRLRPALYTWIFISCDAVSIVAQAAGGGVASAETAALVNAGDDIMIAGIAFQVATMFVCLCLAADFGFQVYKQHGHRRPSISETEETKEMPSSFRYYAGCCAVAFLAIFIRCIYRYAVYVVSCGITWLMFCSIPEMAGGWGGTLMQNQTEFMVLDGT